MEQVGLVVVAILLVWFIWRIVEESVRERRRRQRVSEFVESIKPTFEGAYNQLVEELGDMWPRVTFCFPSQQDLLAVVENRMMRLYDQDVRRAVVKVLEPVVKKARADFIAYNPGFVSGESRAASGVSGDSAVRQNQTRDNYRNPYDWASRRRAVHQRDGGHCHRCGITVDLDRCHIHHVIRRAEGGSHSHDNLVTLCRDCHGLMPQHEIVTGGPFYVLPNRYTLHRKHCHHAYSARRLAGSLPQLVAKGYVVCSKCSPATTGTLRIERFARYRLAAIVNSLV